MHRHFVYPASIVAADSIAKGETGLVITFPDLPEAITQGETLAGALEEAADCLEEAISNRARRRMDIPAPSQLIAGQYAIPISAMVSAKTALAIAMREAGVSNVDLAAVLGKHEKEVRRLLDPAHASKLSIIEDAVSRLGKRVRVILEDAG